MSIDVQVDGSIATVTINNPDALNAFDGGGGDRGEPQAAVGTKVLLRGKVVNVELRRIDERAARRARRVNHGERAVDGRAAPGRHGARRGLVVGPREDVGIGRPIPIRNRDAARFGGRDMRRFQPRSRGRVHELLTELAERAVGTALLDEAECRGVPE